MASKPEEIEENRFVKKVRARGFICFKLATQGPFGEDGYNDRLVLASYGVHALFEFKRDGEEPRKLQAYRHRHLKKLGHETHVVYREKKATRILNRLIASAKKAHEVSEAAKEA